MDMHSCNQYLQALQQEYLPAPKKEKGSLLTEAEKRTGLARKYLIVKLAAKTRWTSTPRKKRTVTYDRALVAPLVKVWDIFDAPCGQRL